ncbi:MAG TPA: sulfurtransferase TusA family protein [Dongiaceae bacterium]|nr:sulfurtransferase TusA family protein [Dongiaceae bacterium]
MQQDDMVQIFDARGLKCPLPVLKARRLIRAMEPGKVLEVQATDPGAPGDFEHFCQTTGHRLLGSETAGDTFVIRIQVADLPTTAAADQ